MYRFDRKSIASITFALILCFSSILHAQWQQFRGKDGSATSPMANIPLEWSEEGNIQWKTKLPGPGSSSPVVSGNHVFITCYSGYGVSSDNVGKLQDLRRHLLCIDRLSGEVRWTTTHDSVPEEDRYSRNLGLHGYATATPVTDGTTVYTFFGKSGVHAYDFRGNELWHADVGRGSGSRKWGSASSPILHNGNVIITAADESLAIMALNGKTGEEVWKVPSEKLASTFSTPLLVDIAQDRQELIVLVPDEIWGLDPATGQCTWYAHVGPSRRAAASVVARDGIVYITAGDSWAIKAGGQGDVTESHVLWTSKDGSGIPSPVLAGDYLYYASDRGFAYCVEAKTGKQVYKEQLGTERNSFYASMVLAGDRLYAFSRNKGCYVLETGPVFKLAQENQFAGDQSDINASPALFGNQMFVRSNQFLYCIASTPEQLAQAEHKQR